MSPMDKYSYPTPYNGNIGKVDMSYRRPYAGNLDGRDLKNQRKAYQPTIKLQQFKRAEKKPLEPYKYYKLPVDYYEIPKKRNKVTPINNKNISNQNKKHPENSRLTSGGKKVTDSKQPSQPRNSYSRKSPTVNDPLKEVPPRSSKKAVTPVVTASRKIAPEHDPWSPTPVLPGLGPLESSHQKTDKKSSIKKTTFKTPVAVPAWSCKAPSRSRQAETIAYPMSPFPSPSPDLLSLADVKKENSPRNISADPMRFEPTYKMKPEPMFPPMIPVSAEEYGKSRPVDKSPRQTTGANPLVPWLVPALRIDNKTPRYVSSQPHFFDDDDAPFPYISKYSSVPGYNAVGSLVRSMEIYNPT